MVVEHCWEVGFGYGPIDFPIQRHDPRLFLVNEPDKKTCWGWTLGGVLKGLAVLLAWNLIASDQVER